MGRLKILSATAIACTLNSLLSAQELPLPATDCSLTFRMYQEKLESYTVLRVRFGGCVSFSGEPVPEFIHVPNPGIPCALELEHTYDSESKIIFWVYQDKEPNGYSDETWNTLIYDIMDEYPEEYTVEFEKQFEEDRDSGAPVLNYVPLKGVVSISENKENGNKFWYLLSLVPVKGSGKVVMIALRTQEKHYNYMRPVYETFTKRLYLDNNVILED